MRLSAVRYWQYCKVWGFEPRTDCPVVDTVSAAVVAAVTGDVVVAAVVVAVVFVVVEGTEL
jgi:hypothetical protein